MVGTCRERGMREERLGGCTRSRRDLGGGPESGRNVRFGVISVNSTSPTISSVIGNLELVRNVGNGEWT